MSFILFIPAVILAAASVVLLVYWSVAIYRIAQTSALIPTARAGIDLARAEPPFAPVCIVVPAHNEEEVLPVLIASLRRLDYPAFHVVLALDRCTDRSVQAAREAIGADERFEVIEIDHCPDEWAGKVHAIWTGVRRSAWTGRAEYLLFADADTVFAPECVRAAVALARHRRLDLLSLLSTLTRRRWFERLIQPAAGLQLVYQYPILRANRLEDRRAFANGQFMLFSRDAYEAIGGHEAVREHLLEDLALARAIDGAGRRAGVFLADGLLLCRMYPGWPAFRRGWKRIYTEAANRKPARLRRSALRMAALGAVLPGAGLANIALLAGPWADGTPMRAIMIAVSAAGLAAWVVAIAWVQRLGHAPIWEAPGSLIGSWIVAGILREAASDLEAGRPTQWGGRSYARPIR
ncbi:MAG: glycosyltransferase [Phycisphaerales bacterium]|nr:glycosyltransferase [Phycisphaerales bacterium]